MWPCSKLTPASLWWPFWVCYCRMLPPADITQRRWWMKDLRFWRNYWIILTGETPKYTGGDSPTETLSTIRCTRIGMGSNPDLQCDMKLTAWAMISQEFFFVPRKDVIINPSTLSTLSLLIQRTTEIKLFIEISRHRNSNNETIWSMTII